MKSDQGSILIPVAVCLLGLLTFSAFTIDNGIMLSSRRQAQNAADAGALAAALYLAWDDSTDQAGAQAAAVEAAQLNQVWGSQPDVTLADVTFPTCPPGAPGPVDQCVRVDVYRNQRANGNPLPSFFASLAGVTEQGVRATATAQVVYGEEANQASCLLPFAVPDRWVERREAWDTEPPPAPPEGDAVDDTTLNYPYDDNGSPQDVWDPADYYDVVEVQGQGPGDPLTGIVDEYIEGSFSQGGTGYDIFRDHGMQLATKENVDNRIAPSFHYPIVLPDGGGRGSADYIHRILNCTDVDMSLGIEPENGMMRGPTRSIQDLIDADQGARWVDELGPIPAGTLRGYVAGSAYPRSPRLRTVPVFDIHNYMTGHRTGRLGDLVVTGYIGVFIDRFVNDEIFMRLTGALFDADATNTTDDTSSFLRDVILVR